MSIQSSALPGIGQSQSTAVRYLLDANILLRRADVTSAQHATANAAIATLTAAGAQLCIVPQCLYEFWAVATRPAQQNGLAYTPAQVAALLTALQSAFALLPDSGDI